MARIAIIGCGLIGRAWTISFLRGGHEVALSDADADAATHLRNSLPETFADLRQHGLLSHETEPLLARLFICAELEAAVAGAVHVQENTSEVLDTKRTLFTQLDAASAPQTVLASSTSGLLPSHIFAGLAGGHRCLVAHPINPPYLVPAVEIVPGPETIRTTVTQTVDLLTAIGQIPIAMTRELDGFVMNRLQGALLDEAFRLVDEGYASPEDVDVGIREGLALRWSFMGPFETIDLNAPNGVRDYTERYAQMYQAILSALPKETDWTGDVLSLIEQDRREILPHGKLKQRQAWRDRRLMALVEHKKNAEKDLGK